MEFVNKKYKSLTKEFSKNSNDNNELILIVKDKCNVSDRFKLQMLSHEF